MPFRTHSDDFLVQCRGNPSAHGNNHGLALKHSLTFLKVLHNISGNVLDTVRTADESFQLCPLGFGFLYIVHRFRIQLLV